MKHGSEFTVGAITLAAIALLILVTFQLENFDIFSKQATYYAKFSSTSGLEENAPVQVNGVLEGKVTQVKRTSGSMPVQVEFSLPKEVILYSNAAVRISTSGMLGERFLDINPGAVRMPGSTQQASVVEPGYMFEGRAPMGIDALLAQTPEMMENLADTIVAIRNFVVDPQNQESLRGTLMSVRNITQKVDDMLTTNSGRITAMVGDWEETTREFNQLTTNLNAFIVELRRDWDTSRQTLSVRYNEFAHKGDMILNNVENMTKELNLVADRMNGAINETQPQIKEITANISQMTRELNQLTSGINEGKGTIGKLAIDPGPFRDLSAILDRIRTILEGGGASSLRSRIQYEPPRSAGQARTAPPAPPAAPSPSASPAAPPAPISPTPNTHPESAPPVATPAPIPQPGLPK